MNVAHLSLGTTIFLFGCPGEPTEPACVQDAGIACVVAGTGSPGANESAILAIDCPLYSPMDVTVWTSATDFFIGDWNNHKIRHVQDGEVKTIIGTEFLGDGDPDFLEERHQASTEPKWH